MNKEIITTPRVRFAPSPTGHLHIGGLRAALFNWLFAKHYHGTYLLRIEDTDLERSKKEYTDAILEAFSWTSLLPDEPIVIQSERFSEHALLLEKLIKEGKAYRCYCPQAEQDESSPAYKKYDRACRNRQQQGDGKPHVIRFALPQAIDQISWNDLIRGTITFDKNELDDFVIARSDGRPVYNFVVVADDEYMGITHVIRGEDHISNTPKQILLYWACGFEVPHFGHLPMILGSSGQRLSKRDAATSVLDYRANGYLPDALINYLVRLGWAYGDQEIFTRQELIQFFSIEGIGKKSAVFDQDKLDWINSMYMRSMSSPELLTYMINNVVPTIESQLQDWNKERIISVVTLYKERTKTVRELAQEIITLYHGPTSIANQELQAHTDAHTVIYLKELIKTLEGIDQFTVDLVAESIKALCKKLAIKLPQLAQPVRLALVGKTTSPGIFELLEAVGKNKSLERIQHLIEWLEKKDNSTSR